MDIYFRSLTSLMRVTILCIINKTGSPAKYQGCPKILITKLSSFAYILVKIK